jgi:hypothetical protein
MFAAGHCFHSGRALHPGDWATFFDLDREQGNRSGQRQGRCPHPADANMDGLNR